MVAVASSAQLLARVGHDRAGLNLIVLDLQLPDAPGVALVRSLRKLVDGRVPLLIFSGSVARAQEVRELAALGVQHLVLAPLPVDEAGVESMLVDFAERVIPGVR